MTAEKEPSTLLTTPDLKGTADRRLLLCSSERRLSVLLEELDRTSDNAEWWQLLQRWWTECDDTWSYMGHLQFLHAIARTVPRRHMLEENLSFWQALPDEFEVFRGCSLERARGLSRTTDRSVALGFAQGHRGIAVPEPVLCRGRLRKSSGRIFFLAATRGEHEVVLNPGPGRGFVMSIERLSPVLEGLAA